jgi:sugar/nucleoside kinase (ribokinase family)
VSVDVISVGYLTLDEITASGATKASMGGGALYAALGATSCLCSAGIVAHVGQDFPESGLDLLRGIGVDCSGVRVRAGDSAQFSVRYDSQWNEHYDHVHLGVAADVGVPDIPESFQSARAILVNSILPPLQEPFVGWAQQHGMTSVLTTNYIYLNDEVLRDSLFKTIRNVDIMVCNRREAEALVGTGDATVLVRRLRELGPQPVVTASDFIWFMNEGRPDTLAVPTSEVTDPTGAGDTFAGAIAAGAALSFSLPDTLKAALSVGAIAVQGFGPSALLEVLKRQ